MTALGTRTHRSVSPREEPQLPTSFFVGSEWAQLHSTATVAVAFPPSVKTRRLSAEANGGSRLSGWL